MCVCEVTLSLECRPASIHTTARPSAASACACASVSPRASPSRRAMSRQWSSRWRFSGEETTIISWSRPSDVLPSDTSLARGDSLASVRQ